jgi:hypothetical protein
MWKNIVEPDRPQVSIYVVRRMRVTCWITDYIEHSTMGYLLLFHNNSGYANAPQCYVTRTLPILFECRPRSQKDHFAVSATAVLSKVCLLNSVSVSKLPLQVLISLCSYSWMFSGIYCTAEVVVKWVT